jgi:prophage regulatory protein
MRLVGWQYLRDLGITFSRGHIDRLVKQGLFPRPVKLGFSTQGWIEDEIEQYLAEKAAARAAAGPTWQPAAQAEP